MKNFKEELAKTRKVALYAHMLIDDYCTVWEVHYSDRDTHYDKLPDGELRELPMEGYVRISEPVSVGFKGIGNDAIVQKAVESLDEEERKVREELAKKIANIRERKNQLLALTHSPDPA